MSSQRGNLSRHRPQKYKNTKAFKNDLHDKTPKMQFINSIEVANVCRKCANILEWKIKYKKYKPLKAPRKCTKCDQKSVKSAYHIMCLPCSKRLSVCPKCGKNEEIVKESSASKAEQFKLDQEMQQMIKSLSERKRRTFLRYMSKQCGEAKTENSDNKELKKDLLIKLESLKVDDGMSDLFDESDEDESSKDEDDESAKDEDSESAKDNESKDEDESAKDNESKDEDESAKDSESKDEDSESAKDSESKDEDESAKDNESKDEDESAKDSESAEDEDDTYVESSESEHKRT